MGIATYPHATLPEPATLSVTPLPRVAMAGASGPAPASARALLRELTAEVSLEWLLRPGQVDALYTWWANTVHKGGAWFRAPLWWFPWGRGGDLRLPGLTLDHRGGRGVRRVSARGWLRALSPDGGPEDPFELYVTLLLRMNGTNGSTTFVDDSVYHHAMTAAGNAQLSTAAPISGSASGLFDGTSDRVWTPSDDGLRLPTAPFTVEGKFSVTGTGRIAIGTFAGSSVGWQVFVNGTNQLVFQVFNPSGVSAFQLAAATFVPNDGAVHHFAAQRRAAQLWDIWCDGVSRGQSAVYSGTVRGDASYQLSVGARGDAASSWNGKLDNMRITYGVARYTAPFTPPETI